MLQNYKFTIAYDGSRFFGWERQPDRETIQGKLESVLSRLQGENVEIIGAGRTDAGVHARAMVANAALDVELSPEEIRDYMNRYLPDAIAVREVKPCAPRFHARYKAIGKTYRYTVHVGEVKPIFDRKYVTILPYVPDVEAMRAAAEILTGEHDFAAFCTNAGKKKSTVRCLEELRIEPVGHEVRFWVSGDGFLHNQVRIMVGTLLEVGMGQRTPDSIPALFEGKRAMSGMKLPAKGLCLEEVRY